MTNKIKYLELLSKEYPNIQDAATEVINLTAICQLPKGTEYFFSDLHGEHEAFIHLLRSASGIIRTKIYDLFENTLSEKEQNFLANLVYEPESVLSCMAVSETDHGDWKKLTVFRLVDLCKEVGHKYTRSKVRKKMPKEYAYILDELLHVPFEGDKRTYYNEIIHSMIELDVIDGFIVALCHLIQKLAVDSLHILGDIFDRGPRPDLIMNELMKCDNVDIQWGNHDISWMGAACGSRVLMCNVVRSGISYNTFDCLEDGYGINLRGLSTFAAKAYADDPCKRFYPKILDECIYDRVDEALAAKMQKAMFIMQLKLAGQLLERHPEYGMENRNVLKFIDYEKKTVHLEGKDWPLVDSMFPTVDPKDPLKLTEDEEELMKSLEASFTHSEVLHRHIRFLYSHGNVYKCVNSNLLFHGCIPMEKDGSFASINIDGVDCCGREMMDRIERKVQDAYLLPQGKKKDSAVDFMWYLWCGMKSPLFGKSMISAFEHLFVDRPEVGKEVLNPYFTLSEKEEVCNRIFEEFGLDPDKSHIINGHMPVKIKAGEKPVKAGGKLYVIDGGISKAYHSKTGIAGYTLITNSHFMALAEHHDITDVNQDISNAPQLHITEKMPRRLYVADTDIGASLRDQIKDLKDLIEAYQEGQLKEFVRK